jgi:uncharacterized membrane protein
MIWTYGLYGMAAVYVVAGFFHFRSPGFYLPLMPPYLPYPVFLNYASGVAEILVGFALLSERTRVAAAWLVIAMLIGFLSVHLYMLQERSGKFARVPEFLLWIRLPAQLVLMAWAYVYTKAQF